MPPDSDTWTHRRRNSCRACNSNRLRVFLELGPIPLANSFLKSVAEFADERAYPLDVCFCESCSLVQLVDVIHPEVLFRNYIYVTGTSDTIAAHNQQYACTIVEKLRLQPSDSVIEVASNDGSLLKCFREYGVKILGVEPATNIAEMARNDGIATVDRFFNAGTADELRQSHGLAKVVIGNNVLAHVDDPQDFLRGCKNLIEEDGLVVVEVPYLRHLLEQLEYDTIYHEHLCYFSVTALARLCDEVGLSIVQVDHVPVHGGSIRMYAARSHQTGSHADAVVALMKQENLMGLNDFSLYQRFADSVERNRRELQLLFQRLSAQGSTVAGYGAPAKGNTLLNYCGIDSQLLPYTVDKNPMKVGLYTPGTHVPIMPVSVLLEQQPDYVLILAWNFAEEIVKQQLAYQQKGGRFITPIPAPREV